MPKTRSAARLRELPAELLEGLRSGLILLDPDGRCTSANAAACRIMGRSADDLVGREFLSLLHPGDREAMRHLPFTDSVFWSAALDGQDAERTVKGHAIPLQGGCAVEFWDDTDESRVQREAHALLQIADSLTYEGSLEKTMNSLAERVNSTVHSRAVAVVLITEEPLMMQIAGSSGLPPGYTETLLEVWRNGGRSAVWEAFRSGRTVVVNASELKNDPTLQPMSRYVEMVKWDIVVCVPMKFRGRTLGILSCYFGPRCGGEHDCEAKLQFLKGIADQVAITVENVRLIGEAKGKAALEERQRLSRELHDSVSQALYGIALGARTARELADQNPAAVKEPLDYVLTLAEAALAEMRSLIFELRPESLESEGLVSAVSKQMTALQVRHGLRARTVLCEEPDLPLGTKQELYRLIQEALHNIVKHARASSVELRAQSEAGQLVLTIQDDGVGFETGRAFPGHFGLQSMAERAASLGGGLEIRSEPGGGTRLRLQMPLP